MNRAEPTVLVCLDKFRGSATAADASAAVAAGIRGARPSVRVVEIPMADGGEGTVDALVRAGYGRRRTQVAGPEGRLVTAAYALREGRAVVEMAQASGLDLMSDVSNAVRASTTGTGQLITAALDTGCHTVVLTAGGSASTDGGAGLLVSLGARLRRPGGGAVEPGGIGLLDLDVLDLSLLDPRLAGVDVVLAADVDNPLLGPSGAAAVFAPQKGASPAEVDRLEVALTRFADRLEAVTGVSARDRPGAGAAGGIGFAAFAALGARFVSGVDFLIDELGVAAALSGADVVVVGEGSLDAQSLNGKAPIGVARRAHDRGVRVIAVAGQVRLSAAELVAAGIDLSFSLLDRSSGVEQAMGNAIAGLTAIGAEIAATL